MQMDNMNERITLVDLDDRVTGYSTKEDVHQQGLLHRAFSVFLVSGDRMLLQKRNPNKYHSGGLWSNACCSHQRETEELTEAVHRRMSEELGIDCPLEELFTFVYRTEFTGGITEYELDHVFLGDCRAAEAGTVENRTSAGCSGMPEIEFDPEKLPEIQFDPEEASEIRWVRFEDLKRELAKSPEQFSSWFIISAPKVLAKAKENAKAGQGEEKAVLSETKTERGELEK